MVNSEALDRTFAACSHPIRRGILERLTAGTMSVGQASGGFGVSKPAISRHLKILEDAGAIVRVVDGRNHLLSLPDDDPGLDDALDWMRRQRAMWERKLDVIEDVLAEQRTATKEQP